MECETPCPVLLQCVLKFLGEGDVRRGTTSLASPVGVAAIGDDHESIRSVLLSVPTCVNDAAW